jgi:dienelactone hydrolase
MSPFRSPSQGACERTLLIGCCLIASASLGENSTAQSQSVPQASYSAKAEDWPAQRKSILDGLQKAMGTLPDRTGLPKVRWEVISESSIAPSLTLQRIRLESETGIWVPAYLLLPSQGSDNLLPAVLCLHQTISIGKDEPVGLGGSPNLHYAIELASRGFVALAPDYPSFGEYEYDFARYPQWPSGSLKAVWDNMRAVDLLTQLSVVDPKRIGCIGHSLGGHNSIFTAVFDERIRAVVSSCGFTRFHKYYGGDLKGWTSLRYMPRIATEYDSDPDRVPFDFPQLIAAIAPRAFFSSSPQHDANFDCQGVRETIDEARVVFDTFGVSERLEVVYPDCEHDFPETSRLAAYRFLEENLR